MAKKQYRSFTMRQIRKHILGVHRYLDAPDWSLQNLVNLADWARDLARRTDQALENAIEQARKEKEQNDGKEEQAKAEQAKAEPEPLSAA